VPRRLATFRQHDLTRALRAARVAGLAVSGYEIDSITGKITIKIGTTTEPAQSALEKWLSKHPEYGRE